MIVKVQKVIVASSFQGIFEVNAAFLKAYEEKYFARYI
jgi:hypothetical protein